MEGADRNQQYTFHAMMRSMLGHPHLVRGVRRHDYYRQQQARCTEGRPIKGYNEFSRSGGQAYPQAYPHAYPQGGGYVGGDGRRWESKAQYAAAKKRATEEVKRRGREAKERGGAAAEEGTHWWDAEDEEEEELEEEVLEVMQAEHERAKKREEGAEHR
jgi:hypothetical protein